MQTYHLFAIKKEFYKIYKNNSYSLYKVLYNLYNLNKIDLNYGITLYNQLCYPINTKKIKQYFELLNNIRKGNNKYLITYKNNKINKRCGIYQIIILFDSFLIIVVIMVRNCKPV